MVVVSCTGIVGSDDDGVGSVIIDVVGGRERGMLMMVVALLVAPLIG